MSRLNTPTTKQGSSGAGAHSLIVTDGRQAGARAEITAGSVMTVGTGLDNDVVLYSHGAAQCQLTLTSDENDLIEMVVDEGEVLKNGKPLEIDVLFKVDASDEFGIADSLFRIEFANEESATQSQSSESNSDSPLKAADSSSNRSLTYVYIVGGLVLLTSVVTTSLVRAFQKEESHKQTLLEELKAAGYENLHVIPAQGKLPAKVSGSVFSSQDRSNILEIAAQTQTNIELDLQINEDLTAEVQDVYRVNGIKADVRVSGIGEVEVWTSTKNEELLTIIESSIKKDIPTVLSLATTNSVPVDKIVEINPLTSIDPDSQITLVVAGDDGYLMTRDRSRYFVGAMLPSGHVIQKIEDGSVYVNSENGTTLVLEFN